MIALRLCPYVNIISKVGTYHIPSVVMVFVAALLSYGFVLSCYPCPFPYLNHEELEVYKNIVLTLHMGR